MNWNIATEEGMANAIAWQNKMLSVIKQGGRWVVPRSGSIYEVDHANKVVRRCFGILPEPDIERVLKAAGWAVVDAEAAHG